MADSDPVLAVRIEGRINDLEKSLAKASKAFSGTSQVIEKRAAQSAQKINNVYGGMTSNLAAQFNDIAVTIAGGMSPLQVALQQGTQITQVLGQRGAAGAAKALGSAFLSLLNPVSLATIGIVGLGGAAVQYLMSMINDGKEVERTLEEQNKLILNVAKAYGETYPALKKVADEIERIQKTQDINTATADAIKQQYEPARKVFAGITRDYEKLISAFDKLKQNGQIGVLARSSGLSSDDVVRTVNEATAAYDDFNQKINDGKASIEDVQNAQAKLTSLFKLFSVTDLSPLINQFKELSNVIGQAAPNAQQLREQSQISPDEITTKYLEDLKKVNSLGKEELQIMKEQESIAKSIRDLNGTPLPPDQLRQQAIDNIAADDRRRNEGRGTSSPSNSYGGGGYSSVGNYDATLEGLRQHIDLLGLQYEAQAKVNPLFEDYGYSVAKVRAYTDLLNAAQQDNINISPDLLASIDQQAEAYARAEAASNRLANNQSDLQKNMGDLKDATIDFASALITGFNSSEDALNSFGKSLQQIGTNFINSGLNMLFDSITGGIFGGGKKSIPIPALKPLSSGGYTGNGGKYQPMGVVHGGEYVFSKQATSKIGVGNLEAMHRSAKGFASGGFVSNVPAIPNLQNMAFMRQPPNITNARQATGGNEVVTVKLQADQGLIADIADQQIQTRSGAIVKVSVEQSVKSVRSNFGAISSDYQKRRG